MIVFDKFTLKNGLKVIVHTDNSTPIVAMNVLYNVGSRDENPERTGFAHLFEHLMFGGSINIERYDEPLERAGGENNAFTNDDFTNYYLTVPVHNLETAFWLESDRMLDLAFSEKSLDVQRNVVVEEFYQNYLNQPYGDAWLLLKSLAYKVHPYQWATIGKEPKHISEASMQEVKDFYAKFYNPCNAILVVAGDVETENIKRLCEKWFEPIEKGYTYTRNLPKEPVQTAYRSIKVERDVPFDAIYMAWHTCSRLNNKFYATDLISDILSAGESSRLYQRLVKERQLFSSINAYISGNIEEGLFVITGKLMKGVSMDQGEQAIIKEVESICKGETTEKELQKVKNRVEALLAFNEMRALDKAMNLAYYELLGNAQDINGLYDKYAEIHLSDIQETAKDIFKETNCSTLFYKAKKH